MTSALYKKKGRGGTSPRHVRLYHSMLKGTAWKSLDAVARAIYIEISTRYGGPGSNNGRIPYSIREAAKALNIGKTTAARGFMDLQDRGFIVAVKRGGFNRKDRHATEWRLTEFDCDVSHERPTRDYDRWTPKSTQIQNVVSPGGLTVPGREPFGTHRRTVAA